MKNILDMTLAEFANWMRDNVSDDDHTPPNEPLFKQNCSTFCAQKSAFVNGNEIRFTASMTEYDPSTEKFVNPTLSITTYKVNGNASHPFYIALSVTNAWAKNDERTYLMRGNHYSPDRTLWDALVDCAQKRLAEQQEQARKEYTKTIDAIHKIGLGK